jgi:hypothetical protein
MSSRPTLRAVRASVRLRIRSIIAPASLALLISSCASLRGRDPERENIETLQMPRTEAVRRTLATFREQGYEIKESLTSGSNPETKPFRQRDDADAIFRAAITGSGSTSRVVFSGTYRERKLGGLMHGDEREVRNTDEPVEKELWARLSNLALQLRKTR